MPHVRAILRPMTLQIRPANPDDAPTIHGFIQGLADYERAPDAVEATPGQLAQQLASDVPPFECLLAEQDGVALGFALFFPTYSTWKGLQSLYLEDLFVPPEHRGRGIGKALLKRVAQIAVERGCGRLEWAVLDWNEPAIRFYEILGAEAQSEWVTYRVTGNALARLGAP